MITKTVRKSVLPLSNPGNEKYLFVIRYGKPNSRKKVYIQSGLHADESPGFIAMHHLIALFDRADRENRIQSEIILVPAANPIGWDQWDHDRMSGRFESATGVNFNRDYPDLMEKVIASVKKKLSSDGEQNKKLIRKAMGRAIRELATPDQGAGLKKTLLALAHDADIVLDLHCDERALLHVYCGTPLWPGAADLSAQLGAQATLLARDSGGEPFDEACGKIWWALAKKFPKHPIPSACLAATVELGGYPDVGHAQAARNAENIFLFLQRRGFLKGKAPQAPRLLNKATPLKGVEFVKAEKPGVVIYLKFPGEAVKAGEVIAHIVNPCLEKDCERIREVKSGIDGLLFAIRVFSDARPGCILAKIAGKTPLKEKGKHLLTA